MILLPQKLFASPEVKVLLRDGQNCVLSKSLSRGVSGREAYLATHAVSLVLAGEQRLRTYDETLATVGAGELAVLPRGLYYVTDLKPAEGNFRSLLFYFDDLALQEYLAVTAVTAHRGEEGLTPFAAPQSVALRTFATALVDLLPSPTLGRAFLRLKTLELLHLVRATTGRAADFDRFLFRLSLPRQRNIKGFMERNYHKPLKIEDYAYLTGRSPTTFRRDFKAYYNTTPQRWLREQRLQRAEQLARHGNSSVTDLAHAVGYDNVSYFIREFRRRTGTSPKQFMLGRRAERDT